MSVSNEKETFEKNARRLDDTKPELIANIMENKTRS